MPTDLAQVLAGEPIADNRLVDDGYPYGKPRFPNLDPRAYFDEQTRQNYAKEPWHEGLPAYATGALAAIRPSAASTSMRPFNPNAPAQPLPMRPDGEAMGQAVYEAALGRPPGGAPGSGSFHVPGVGGLPKSPLAWGAAGAGTYGIWNALGGPEHVQKFREAKWYWPGTPEYEERLRQLRQGTPDAK